MDQQLLSLVKALTGFGSKQMEEVGVTGFIFVMLVSLACSVFIAHLYRYFYSNQSTGSQIHRAFPLLGISITSIFITIQFSLPLSLGLLGALSIVRFRTPIKEPEEIGFIMLVIACSISAATFNFIFLGIILFVAVGALMILKSGLLYQKQDNGVVIVTLPTDRHESIYSQLVSQLDKLTVNGRIESISKSDTESVVSYAFKGLGQNSLSDLQVGLNELVGESNYNIFVNQQRVL